MTFTLAFVRSLVAGFFVFLVAIPLSIVHAILPETEFNFDFLTGWVSGIVWLVAFQRLRFISISRLPVRN